MAKFGNGIVFFFFFTYTVQTRLLMLKCLDVAFNETLFLIRLSKSIYKFGYRFIGQHIGYRHSNIKNYQLSAKIFISVHP